MQKYSQPDQETFGQFEHVSVNSIKDHKPDCETKIPMRIIDTKPEIERATKVILDRVKRSKRSLGF